MGDIAQLGIKIDPTGAVSGLGIVRREATRTERAVGNAAKRMGQAFVLFGGIVSVVAVKMASDFQKGMREVSTLMDGITSTELQEMSDKVQDLRVKYGQLSKDATKALFDITSAGFQGADGMVVLEEASKLAVAGVSDVAATADLLTSAMNAYNLSAEDAAEISDIFFATQKQGKTTISELAQNMGQVLPTANLAGLSLQELGGALATLTLKGISTSESVTALNQLLLSLVAPTKDSKEAFVELGIETKDAAGKMLPLLDIMKQMEGFNAETLSELFPNVRALKGAAALVTSLEKMKVNIDAVKNGAGATSTAFAKMSDTAAFELAAMKQGFKVFLETLGNVIIESKAYRELVQDITKAFKGSVVWLRVHRGELENIALVLTGSFATALDGTMRGLLIFENLFLSIAAQGLKVAATIGVLTIPLANLYDTIAGGEAATQGVLKNLHAAFEASDELFAKRIKSFNAFMESSKQEELALRKVTVGAIALKKEMPTEEEMEKPFVAGEEAVGRFFSRTSELFDLGGRGVTFGEVESPLSKEFIKSMKDGKRAFDLMNASREVLNQSKDHTFWEDDTAAIKLNTIAQKNWEEAYADSLNEIADDSETMEDRVLASIDRLSSGMETSLSSTLGDILRNTGNFADDMISIFETLEDEILRLFVIKPLLDSLTGTNTSIFSFGGGGGKEFFGPGFATGGDFTVGGAGGVDSSVVSFRATPGEKVSVRNPSQGGGDGGGIAISVQVNADGSASTDAEGASETGEALALLIRNLISEETRPGGLIYRMSN